MVRSKSKIREESESRDAHRRDGASYAIALQQATFLLAFCTCFYYCTCILFPYWYYYTGNNYSCMYIKLDSCFLTGVEHAALTSQKQANLHLH